ncbi:unnamed protein product [Microthlaspi erraticum]|uniref:MATH domain-containing protein n=1 Tax=Microthlaspi erraticum TaxID=1685480 RepID=A0A6D2IYX6_9BRAS|nr:unnamed protein product [Microthlaspi erraticum]
MENEERTSFTFEIDNFSEKGTAISSPTFSSGSCEWLIVVSTRVDSACESLCLDLGVAYPESLRLGWKRRARFSFSLLNQSCKELQRTSESCSLFFAQKSRWGWSFPLEQIQANGVLEKNKLRVKVEVKVVEVVDEGVVTGNETFDFHGFQVLCSQAASVSQHFRNYPDFAVNVRTKNQLVKTTYMNILLGLIETLNKPPDSLSETELNNALSELLELTEAGFKLNWLMKKLIEVSLEWTKENGDVCRVQVLREHIKNLEVEMEKEKAKYDKKYWSLRGLLWELDDELRDEQIKTDTEFLRKAAKDLREAVVHSWNELKARLRFADLRNEKIE